MSEPLEINGVGAHYGSSEVLRNLSLRVDEGELVSLLGSSGCGKTTTLRLVAGFLQPTSGTISLGTRNLTALPSHKRDIGIVFQNYALFPHMTVKENVGFGLKQRGISGQIARNKIADILGRVGLAELADRHPVNLSGGQKQRVALARALVIQPPLLMFDEPLSNLDAKLRIELRTEIRQLQRQNNTTAIYVTHDQEEAFAISDRVAIMNAGQIVQLDRPEVLYRQPSNEFVARFVGFENLIPMTRTGRQDGYAIAEAEGGFRLKLPENALGQIPEKFVLAARSEGMAVERTPNPMVAARVLLRTYLGSCYEYRLQTATHVLLGKGPLEKPLDIGEDIDIRLVPEHCAILQAGSA